MNVIRYCMQMYAEKFLKINIYIYISSHEVSKKIFLQLEVKMDFLKMEVPSNVVLSAFVDMF